jgi:hypothetical protein
LDCTTDPIPGAAACLNGSSPVYCCPAGQTIANGACTAPICPSGEVISPITGACVYDLAQYVMPGCNTDAAWNTVRSNNQTNFWRFVPLGGDPALGAHFVYIKSPDGWDFEEYRIDSTAIRLVKDTSWAYQDPPGSTNWCDEQCGPPDVPCKTKRPDPSVAPFAYAAPTDANPAYQNLGAERLPRYFDPNQPNTFTVSTNIGAASQSACQSCSSWHSSSQAQTVSFTVTHLPSFTAGNNIAYSDVFELDITDGPGKGEQTFYGRGVGWIGFQAGQAFEWINTPAQSSLMPPNGCSNPGTEASFCSYL